MHSLPPGITLFPPESSEYADFMEKQGTHFPSGWFDHGWLIRYHRTDRFAHTMIGILSLAFSIGVWALPMMVNFDPLPYSKKTDEMLTIMLPLCCFCSLGFLAIALEFSFGKELYLFGREDILKRRWRLFLPLRKNILFSARDIRGIEMFKDSNRKGGRSYGIKFALKNGRGIRFLRYDMNEERVLWFKVLLERWLSTASQVKRNKGGATSPALPEWLPNSQE